jgi:predicted DNA-binding transcriptional regulator YafY
MSINKFALIRYKTIDTCLKNRFRKWTLDDLTEAVAEALYEYEGVTKGISKRTIQLDIQNMRSEKLGYNAPIVVTDKKYYSYEDKNYSITNTPLNNQDIATLSEVVDVLKQFKGFSYFDELAAMVTKLEDKLNKQKNKGRSYIDFEKNELLKGLQFIDPLHRAIINNQALEMRYKSFKANQANSFIFYPYLLKEYRNRWFILGMNQKNRELLNLALDRIESFVPSKEKYVSAPLNIHDFYSDTIGVTKMRNQKPNKIVLKILKQHAPYIITKPIHHSQKMIKETDDWLFFSIDVVWNFELEREILGFGEQLKVVGPPKLRSTIEYRLKRTLKIYEERD